MFAKTKTMKGVISSFTAEAKAILATQTEIAVARQKDIDQAVVLKDQALQEAAIAEAFIANVEAMAQPKAE